VGDASESSVRTVPQADPDPPEARERDLSSSGRDRLYRVEDLKAVQPCGEW